MNRLISRPMFLALTGLCALISSAQAGGWTQPEGEGYAKLGMRGLTGSRGFLPDGSVTGLDGTFTDLRTEIYAEYGLSDRLTLVTLLAPVGLASFSGDADNAAGTGDESTTYVGPLLVGARYGLKTDGALRLAIEGHVGGTPGVGDDSVGLGSSDDGDPYSYTPAVAAMQGDLELQAGLGLSGGYWLSAGVGMRAWAADDAERDPAVTGSFQVGWASGTIVVDLHMNLLQPLGDVEAFEVAGTAQTAYLGIGPGFSWWFNPAWAMHVGLDSVLFAEANAAAAPVVLAVEHRIK